MDGIGNSDHVSIMFFSLKKLIKNVSYAKAFLDTALPLITNTSHSHFLSHAFMKKALKLRNKITNDTEKR